MAGGYTIDQSKLLNRWGALKTERASWFAMWKDLSTYLLPYQGRFFVQDRNRGSNRANQIYDSTGTYALRILGAGMMAGATSPARPWFRLAVPDPDLNSYHSVRVWLDDVAGLMRAVFQRSNTYRALHSIYEELGSFGTGASIVMPDYNTVVHHFGLTAGEYAIATSYRGEVDTIFREFDLPVKNVVREFGKDNCSTAVRNLYNQGNLDAWVPIIHAIEPRADRDTTKKDGRNMPWASYYIEGQGDGHTFLREGGFNRFPALVPRWAVAGGDIYGHSPAMEALGDIKQLQHEQKRKAQGIDYQTLPPLQVPASMKNGMVDILPGGVSYYDGSSPQGGVKNLFEVNLDLNHLLADIQDVRQRIRQAFFADLFLMLANATDTRMTATEVAERHEEKLLMLGPVLERLHNELLSPLIEITFDRILSSGILPPPPDELRGMEITVEFISMLAQAQRAIGANSVDRWVGSLGAVAAYKPDVLDKFDSDYWAESYADMLGVDPKNIVPDSKVAIVRQDRAQQAAQAQQTALAEQQSKAVKNLATSPTDGGRSSVIDMFSGYNTPGQGAV